MSKKISISLLGFKGVCLTLLMVNCASFASQGQLDIAAWGPQYTYPPHLTGNLVSPDQQAEWRRVARMYALPQDITKQLRAEDFRSKADFEKDPKPYSIEKNGIKIWDKGADTNRLINAECMRAIIKKNKLDDRFALPKKWVYFVRGMWRVCVENVDDNIIHSSKWKAKECFLDLFELTELTGYMDWYENVRIPSDDICYLIDVEDLGFYGCKSGITRDVLTFCGGLGGATSYLRICTPMLMLNTLFLGHSEKFKDRYYVMPLDVRVFIQELFNKPGSNQIRWPLPWQNIKCQDIDWCKIRNTKEIDEDKKRYLRVLEDKGIVESSEEKIKTERKEILASIRFLRENPKLRARRWFICKTIFAALVFAYLFYLYSYEANQKAA